MEISGPGVGALCALGSALVWAIISYQVRVLQPFANSVAINAIRSAFGGALLLGWMVVTGTVGSLFRMSLTSFLLLAVSIVIAVVVGDNLFFESTRSLGIARAMTISTTYPLVSAVMAALVLGEAITTSVIVGTVLTLAGVVLIASARGPEVKGGGHWWLGVGAAAAAAIAWGVTPILMKPPLREVDVVTAQVVRLPIAAACLWGTPWMRGAFGRLRDGGRPAMAPMAVVVVLTALSSVLYVSGLKHADIAVATVLSATAPMFAIPIGFFFLGERLGPLAIAGAVVTLIGVAIVQS